MTLSIGVIFAFIAMIGWGFGDFLIQKSTRKVGDWETLFLISFFGIIILTPFVYKDIPSLFLFGTGFWLMVLASVILLFAALLDFEALKEGKLDVVEPIWSLEIIVSAFLAFLILKESIKLIQIIMILFLITGLILVSFRSKFSAKRIHLEKGVALAAMAAVLMGAANFFVGYGSRVSNPLMMNWFLSVFLTVISFIFIFMNYNFKSLAKNYKTQKRIWWGMCIFDNLAWIAFAFAMTLSPIAIAVAISESYIVIAVLLGMFVNKEVLLKHQKIGLVLAIASAIILATTIS